MNGLHILLLLGKGFFRSIDQGNFLKMCQQRGYKVIPPLSGNYNGEAPSPTHWCRLPLDGLPSTLIIGDHLVIDSVVDRSIVSCKNNGHLVVKSLLIHGPPCSVCVGRVPHVKNSDAPPPGILLPKKGQVVLVVFSKQSPAIQTAP